MNENVCLHFTIIEVNKACALYKHCTRYWICCFFLLSFPSSIYEHLHRIMCEHAYTLATKKYALTMQRVECRAASVRHTCARISDVRLWNTFRTVVDVFDKRYVVDTLVMYKMYARACIFNFHSKKNCLRMKCMASPMNTNRMPINWKSSPKNNLKSNNNKLRLTS